MGSTLTVDNIKDSGDNTLVSSTGSGYKMNLSGTTPASPVAGDMYFDTTLNALKIYNGTEWYLISIGNAGLGGIVSTYTGYIAHTFTSSGTFIVSAGTLSCDILIVGGGGGGGCGTGGGGGGGAVLYKSHSITSGTYPIIIGDGGLGAIASDSGGFIGGDTTAFSVTATGGGPGGGEANNGANNNAGANGGGSNSGHPIGVGTAPTASGWSVYAGYDGGGWGGLWVTPGGGGGAGANGGSGGSSSGSNPQTHGGIGVQIGAIIDGTNNYYWGGGGGGCMTTWSSHSGQGGDGGLGGGGAGGNTDSIANPGGGSALNSGGSGYEGNAGRGGAGGANTGGGAGGSSDNQTTGANGGSGIVVIRYAI